MTAYTEHTVYSRGPSSEPFSRHISADDALWAAARRIHYPGDQSEVYAGGSREPIITLAGTYCADCGRYMALARVGTEHIQPSPAYALTWARYAASDGRLLCEPCAAGVELWYPPIVRFTPAEDGRP